VDQTDAGASLGHLQPLSAGPQAHAVYDKQGRCAAPGRLHPRFPRGQEKLEGRQVLQRRQRLDGRMRALPAVATHECGHAHAAKGALQTERRLVSGPQCTTARRRGPSDSTPPDTHQLSRAKVPAGATVLVSVHIWHRHVHVSGTEHGRVDAAAWPAGPAHGLGRSFTTECGDPWATTTPRLFFSGSSSAVSRVIL